MRTWVRKDEAKAATEDSDSEGSAIEALVRLRVESARLLKGGEGVTAGARDPARAAGYFASEVK